MAEKKTPIIWTQSTEFKRETDHLFAPVDDIPMDGDPLHPDRTGELEGTEESSVVAGQFRTADPTKEPDSDAERVGRVRVRKQRFAGQHQVDPRQTCMFCKHFRLQEGQDFLKSGGVTRFTEFLTREAQYLPMRMAGDDIKRAPWFQEDRMGLCAVNETLLTSMDSSCPQFRPAVEAERIQVGGLVGQMVGRRMERTLQAARRTAGRAFDGLVKRGRRREENPRANRGRGW